ncbi:MAG: phytanoyl-CoA dioxygenase family protein [Actinobacteria bacterium]|jgi:Phytanoyl-CoA dioxygenase (PhyH)|nr:phytanoyl-CoA dioxygenase family protein [Actinomycetota bacterium]NBU06096.1 phytanoyl-CoA dioxygenase family protein [Acidimicrobiia bacterium]NCZ67310.1 phytanoyl-CoA dioxygenase family protein [Acidimicrobiia bacterium]NDE20052.1 phytanoyl-CoA dioxygenase family protein [Actinomycetota bacterium]NDF67962.1 phytanoyl-CoA dioxygenase family protein [Actinomycetota bacterium]
MPAQVLTAQELDSFARDGWVVTNLLDSAQTAHLRRWVGEVQDWNDDGNWMNHYELTRHGPRRCRTEFFTPFHEGLRSLLCEGSLLAAASELLGETAVLYKEKINYKLAGGAGWEPHQDAPAYPFIKSHVSCMIAVDDATTENGCLEIVSELHHELIPTDERGCIPEAVAAKLPWRPAPLRAGQTMWFHSRTPHRSGDNRSTRDRRAIYPTYNAAREGDLRLDYYAAKRAELERSKDGERVKISLIDDFRGVPVQR